ncbi:MAG: porin [Thiohalomonadaceae bacterium]
MQKLRIPSILFIGSGILLAAALPTTASAAPEFDFYGSVRLMGETVRPGNTNELDNYNGVRDAYSRLGVNASYDLGGETTLFAQLELPLDFANKAVQDPYDQEQDIRVARMGLRGDFGTLAVGQMWMPYYNAIAWPVDMFSTYYSGFATYTTFRRDNTAAYVSPDLNGFSLSAGWSQENGAAKANGDIDNRIQVTASYAFSDSSIALGLDQPGGEFDARIWGLALTHQIGPIYLGAKVEQHDSKLQSGYGADGDTAAKLYLGYTRGRHTFKAMVANVEGYGENILHLGVDHQMNAELKFFVEYYQEEETAAITSKRGGAADTVWTAEGGRVFAVGMRYDF